MGIHYILCGYPVALAFVFEKIFFLPVNYLGIFTKKNSTDPMYMHLYHNTAVCLIDLHVSFFTNVIRLLYFYSKLWKQDDSFSNLLFILKNHFGYSGLFVFLCTILRLSCQFQKNIPLKAWLGWHWIDLVRGISSLLKLNLSLYKHDISLWNYLGLLLSFSNVL